MRYPKEIKPGTQIDELIQNLDFAPTFLDYAGVEIPHSADILPEDDRLNGEHISDKVSAAVESTKNKIEGAY